MLEISLLCWGFVIRLVFLQMSGQHSDMCMFNSYNEANLVLYDPTYVVNPEIIWTVLNCFWQNRTAYISFIYENIKQKNMFRHKLFQIKYLFIMACEYIATYQLTKLILFFFFYISNFWLLSKKENDDKTMILHLKCQVTT